MSVQSNSPATLIATLGSEAQVVTLTLDELLRRQEPVTRVIVLHTTPPAGPVSTALDRLRSNFSEHYTHPPVELLTEELTVFGQPLADVDTTTGARGAFAALYRLIRSEKLAGRRVHLCIAGGRKTMTVFGMAAAQMLFDAGDHLWHLFSQGKLLDEKRMHAQPGDVYSLVEIPVILWSAVSPVLTDLRQIDDPFEAVERQRARQLNEALEEARAFVLGVLTTAERKALEHLVRSGLSNAEIGDRLALSPRTVERHLGEIAAKAAVHWELDHVSRAQLISLLNLYYTVAGSQEIGGNPA